MPSVSAESLRREVAHYMNAELGLKVKIPEKAVEKGGGRKTAAVANGKAGKKGDTVRGKTASAATSDPSPSLAARTSPSVKASTHKARQRERKKKQRAAAAASVTTHPAAPAPATSSSLSPAAGALGKTARKNRLRHEKEKLKREGKLLPPSHPPLPASLIIDPSIKNSTKPSIPALPTRDQRVAAQQLSQVTIARLSSLSSSLEQGKWHTHPQAQSTPPPPQPIVLTPAQSAHIESLRSKAASLLSAYARSVGLEGSGMSAEDQRWLTQIMSSGTLTDKIAGMQLIIQDRPLGRLDVLERLLSMAAKKGRRESVLALDALKEAFLNELIPHNRPLHFFSHHPALLSSPPDELTLLYLYYEDRIKHAYSTYLTLLSDHLSSPLSYIKKHAISLLFSLLSSLPEQERIVLSLLTNKLGDPDRRVSSKVVYLLTHFIVLNPAVRLNVVKELESLLIRPGISERAQYYAIIFLNQIKFSAYDHPLASAMISVYLSFFTQLVSKKPLIHGKLLGAIITGINRALPYAPDVQIKEAQMDFLYWLSHTAGQGTAVQCLMLLSSVRRDDRFYRAVYEVLLKGDMGSGGKNHLLLNLVYKTMKGDDVQARVAAMGKRLVQVGMGKGVGFLCGVLYLLSEVMRVQGGMKAIMAHGDWKADDEEEHFVDVKDEDEQDAQTIKDEQKENGRAHGSETQPRSSSAYDPHKRDPLYANALYTGFWELTALLHHYHPSVQAWARLLLSCSPIAYSGDPLADFTLTAFLDRFVFRNPKKASSNSLASHLQHVAVRDAALDVAVSSARFLAKREEDVREDDKFYWLYFHEKERREAAGLGTRRKKKNTADEEERADDEEAIDEFADRLMEEEMLKAQNGELDDEDELLEELRKERQAEEKDQDESDDADLEGEDAPWSSEQMAAMDRLVDEDEGAEAAAEAEAFGVDEEDELPSFSEEDDEDDEDDGEEESHRQKKKKRLDGAPRAAGVGSASVFASAEEFSDLLNEGLDSEHKTPKEKLREYTHDRPLDDGTRKRRGSRGGIKRKR